MIERHNCRDCKHYHKSASGPERWRDGKHSYISGERESNARSCDNTDGLCRRFTPLSQAATHGGEE